MSWIILLAAFVVSASATYGIYLAAIKKLDQVEHDDTGRGVLANLDDLTTEERRYLAMHARYESDRQDDFRYAHADRAEGARLKVRWREIADALHPDPWSETS